MQAGQQPPGQHQNQQQGKPPGQQPPGQHQNQQQGKPPGQQPASKATNDNATKAVELLTTVLGYVKEFFKLILRCSLQLMAWVIQFPVLITGPLRLGLFGLMAFYTIGVNSETYIMGLKGAEPFIPKFLINDGAILANLGSANQTLVIAGLLMSLVTTAVCTSFWRDISPAKAKKQYDEVKGQTIDPARGNEINLVGYRRKKHKRSGMKRIRLVTFAGLAFTVIDIVAAGNTYNPLGGPIKFLWFVVSTTGSEFSFALCMDALDDFRAFIAELRVNPKTVLVK
jgi:hypothetical protein